MTIPAPPVGALTREQELLLLCARTRFTGERSARAAGLVSGGLDWERLFAAAATHTVLPLLARSLAAVPGVPVSVAARLTDQSRATARRGAWLAAELFRVLDVLDAAGIGALVHKGPVLGREAWGDSALRPFADLDLVVRDADLPAAAAALLVAGLEPAGVAPGRKRRALFAHAWEVELVNRHGLVVDVHRSLVARHLARGPRTAELFDRRRTVTLDGRAVPTLGRDDTLLALCLGGTSELWSRLKFVVDVAELLQSPGEHGWPALLDRARRDGALRMVLLGVSLGCDHAGLPLPEPVAAALSGAARVETLRRRAWRRLFARSGAPPGYLERNRYWLAARDRPSDRASSLWLRLWTPTVNDWRFVPLPDLLYPLYYLVRPIRLVWHAVTRWLPELVWRRG